MRLLELELYGFKSFAKRTKIKFSEGVTAIVGPNGSGKSNIVDGIIWALGEQSAKQLRGQKMEDVIFSGTESRAPLGFAEVTLVFDNSDRFLDIDFQEVSIRRKMYRSGESEFYINKEPVRLKDIRNLFVDTGIGKDGYSFIGQGQIDQVLSNRPQDRRAIFEEAAGIGRFRAQKDRSLKSLEKTRDNLLRLEDILAEVQAQEEGLREERARAQTYLEARDQEKDLKTRLFLLQDRRLAQDLGTMTQDLERTREEREGLEEALEANRQASHQARLAQEAQREDYEALYEKRLDLGKSLEKTQAEIQNLQALASRLENETKDKEGTLASLKDQDQEAQEEAQDIQTRVQALQARLASYTQAYDKEEARLKKTRAQTRDLEEKKSAWEEEERARITQDSQAQSRLEALVFLNKERAARIQALKDQEASYLAQAQEMEAQFAARTQEREDLLEKRSALKKDLSSGQEALALLSKELEAQEAQARDLEKTLQSLESNLAFNQRVIDNNEDYSFPVKSFLNQIKSLPHLASQVLGPLAGQLEVKEGFDLAVTTSLGGAAQNIIIEDDTRVGDMISFLKERRLGRVTFLPLKSLRPRPYDTSQVPRVPYPVYLASDLVTCQPRLKPAVDFSLARTLVVESLEDGKDLSARLNRRVRIVTKTGDVFNIGGSITGGSQKGKNLDLIKRKKDQAKIKKALDQAKRDLERAHQALKDQTQARAQAQEAQEKTQASLQDKETRLARLDQVLASLESSARDLERRLVKVQEDRAKEAQAQDQTQEDLDGLRGQIQAQDQADRAQALKDMTQALASSKKRAQDQEAYLDGLFKKINEGRNLLRDYHYREDSLKRLQASYRDQAGRILEETRLQTQEVTQSRERAQALAQELKGLEEAQEESDKALARLKEAQAQNKEGLDTAQDQERDLSSRLNEKIRREAFLSNKLQGLEEDLEQVQAYLAQVPLEEKEAISLDPDQTEPSLKRKLKIVQKEIQDLGYVNVQAIEDHEAVSQRLDFLTHQREDLLASRERLQDLAQALDKEMKKVFSISLAQIQENFDEIFKELFHGGQAEILLEDEDQVLDSGIIIRAQPPGKKLQSLSLLSGGERSMTAVALLFALLRVRKSPFCILDEIDAALDEANINRYKDYLAKMQPMQFIMITHRKSTMEIAEYLYGVTMEEKGMSTVISLVFEEVKKDAGLA